MPIKLSILAMAPMPIIPFKATFVWFTKVIPSDGDDCLQNIASAEKPLLNVRKNALRTRVHGGLNEILRPAFDHVVLE